MSIDRVGSITPLVFPGKRGGDASDFGIFRFDIHLAPVATIVTGCCRFFELPGFIDVLGELIGYRADRTDRQAIPAKLAIESLIAFGDHLSKPAFLHELKSINSLYVLTNIDAFATGNAAVHVEIQHQASRIFGNIFLLGIGKIRDPMLERRILQFAVAVCIANGAIQGMDGKVFFDGFLSGKK